MEEIKVIHPQTILFVTKKGDLLRKFTPFVVECLIPVEPFKASDKAEVEKIFTSPEKSFIYLIEGRYYAHFYFVIV